MRDADTEPGNPWLYLPVIDGRDALARHVSRRYAELIARGGWFNPLREAPDGSAGSIQRPVSSRSSSS